MQVLTIDPPNEKQARMLRAAAKYVGFGGARGGGKSWAVRTKAKLLALRYPGIKILIVRRTYPELINNHISILRQELAGIAKYNDKEKVLRFSPMADEGIGHCEARNDTGDGDGGRAMLAPTDQKTKTKNQKNDTGDGDGGRAMLAPTDQKTKTKNQKNDTGDGDGGRAMLAPTDQKTKTKNKKRESTIHFMYCAKDGDLDRLQGVEYDVIFLDEATQLSEWQMKTITACLRGVNGFPKRVYYTCNPGGQGHGYIKRIFIDRQYEAGENPDDYVFIQSLVTDNKALMAAQPEYVRQLGALPEKLRRAWLEGDWDIFEGQFFEELRLSPDLTACSRAGVDPEYAKQHGLWTHVIPAFRPPREWKLYRSFDWGYSKPFSCAWWAVDFDGRLYRILELYGCTKEPNEGVKWTPDKVFSEIRRIENEHPWLAGRTIEGVADPAIWDASGGESIAETAEKYRIWFEPGDHKRIPGWMQCHYRLQFDENGIPMMYVFDSCKAFLRTVPLMVYDAHNVEDLDSALEDHVCDEWRYLCMARPIKPVQIAETKRVIADPLGRNAWK